MIAEPLFLSLDFAAIAADIRRAEHSVCYAAPGIHRDPASAMAEVARRIGPDLITICLDFDERVFRMGFGDLSAVDILREAGIAVRSTPGLRTGLAIVDRRGYIFTPTALYLEAEHRQADAPNAMRSRLLSIDEESATRCLEVELRRVFPRVEDMIEKMQLDARYNDVTFETLNQSEFLKAVQQAFPWIDWEMVYTEFRAAGEPER